MSNIVIYIMLFFAIIGGIDRIRGNKNGLGKEFEEGFKGMGSLALTMIELYLYPPLYLK